METNNPSANANAERKSEIFHLLSGLGGLKWSVALKGVAGGLIAGLLVVLYRLGVEYGAQTAQNIYVYLRENPLWILPWAALAIGAGLLIAWLIRLEPMATGSGIPQVEGVVLYGIRVKYYAVLAVRYVAGILSAFFGLSLGREGPSIQIGACAGQAAGKKLGKSGLEESCIITGGAAAGLAAAFNAPLSGIMFALEEVHRSFSPLVLVSATAAALVADVVSKYFFGLKPILSFASTPQLPVAMYLCMIPLGIVSGLAGSLMNKSLLGFMAVYKKIPRIVRPCLPLLLALPVGLFLPQILGGGQGLIELSETAGAGIVMLLVLFAAKVLFTSVCFGSGVPGGIFMPILSVGALSGAMAGWIAVRLGMPEVYVADFIVCAMAGALSGSVKAPVTSILLIAEMTGSLVHLLPVAACSFIALFCSDALKITPIYEALLEGIVESNKADIRAEEGGNLIEMPVELGSLAAGKCVREITWPEGALLVGIRRGAREMIPKGNTGIRVGDYIVVMSPLERERETYRQIRRICRAR
jgi:H+/Cl- antiporter ClcA